MVECPCGWWLFTGDKEVYAVESYRHALKTGHKFEGAYVEADNEGTMVVRSAGTLQ